MTGADPDLLGPEPQGNVVELLVGLLSGEII